MFRSHGLGPADYQAVTDDLNSRLRERFGITFEAVRSLILRECMATPPISFDDLRRAAIGCLSTDQFNVCVQNGWLAMIYDQVVTSGQLPPMSPHAIKAAIALRRMSVQELADQIGVRQEVLSTALNLSQRVLCQASDWIRSHPIESIPGY